MNGINCWLFTCCWGEGVEDEEGGGKVEPTSSEATDDGDNAHDADDPIVVDIDGFGDGVTYSLDVMEKYELFVECDDDAVYKAVCTVEGSVVDSTEDDLETDMGRDEAEDRLLSDLCQSLLVSGDDGFEGCDSTDEGGGVSIAED